MSRASKIVLALVLLLCLGGGAYFVVSLRRHGFRATEKPSWLETYFARHARRIMTPAGAKNLQNPLPATPAVLASGREHFADHCAVCHGFDGRGKTNIGGNMYPPAPDMTDAETQQLTDGELFYIVQNGVRFTGMPAWKSEHTTKETWELVAFLRHLPQLSPEEAREMREKAAGRAAPHVHQHEHEDRGREHDEH